MDDIACRGIVYRASVSTFHTSRGFAKRINMVEMKKMSCGSCDMCEFMRELFLEDFDVLGIDDVEDGKLYRVELCNITYDEDTPDGWDLKIVPAQEASA